MTTYWHSSTSRRSTGARSGAPTRLSASTRRSNAAPTWSASSPMMLRSCDWWAASCRSSRRNGSWSAVASSPRPPWPKSPSLGHCWSSTLLIWLIPLRQFLQPSAKPQQLRRRSTQISPIAELHIQRSGFIMDLWG